MTEIRLSSLHDDVRMPWQDRDKPEYSTYPQRHANIGEHGEFSALRRIYQFGVTEDDLLQAGISDLRQMTESQYRNLVGCAVEEQYGLIMSNIYDHWWEKQEPEMEKAIAGTAFMVEQWETNWGIHTIQRGQDVRGQATLALISIEGIHLLDGIKDPTQRDVDRALGMLFMNGVRSFCLQYGRDTALATNGLTELGRYTVTKLLKNGLLVDLAHSLPKTRTDTLDLAEELGRGSQISYTHGAPSEAIAKDPDYAGLSEKRGLSDDEIKRIMRLDGIVGLGVSRPFFTSAEQLAETIDRLSQFQNGILSLAIGADFGGVSPSFLIGMNTPAEVVDKLGDLLVGRFKFNETGAQAILAENARVWIQSNLLDEDHT